MHPPIAQQLDFHACEHFKFKPLVGFASHLKVSRTQKSLKTLGNAKQGKSFHSIQFKHFSLLFSFEPSWVFLFPSGGMAEKQSYWIED